MGRLLLAAFLIAACSTADGVESDFAKTDDPGGAASPCQLFMRCVQRGAGVAECAAPHAGQMLCETRAQRAQRQQAIAELRGHDKLVIAHRGSWEFGHENSLEAFRATMELGAEGNEIDIRRTSDGVLILFHDDTVDRVLYGVGLVEELTWDQLREMAFRQPGEHGRLTRIATLAEALQLHREHPGLIHLDIKKSGYDGEIAAYLDLFDMWEQVVLSNAANAEIILQDPRYRPRPQMIGLSVDRQDLDPLLVADAVARAIDGVFVDDPRATLLALGRELGSVTAGAVSDRAWTTQMSAPLRTEVELRSVLMDDEGWDALPSSAAGVDAMSRRIVARAQAAIDLGLIGALEEATLAALEARVRGRSMHEDWVYHGLDGQESFRVLAAMGAEQAVQLAREIVFLDDPALDPIAFDGFPNAAVDWRMKGALWDALEALRGDEAAARLCRSYLQLTDAQAEAIGFKNFEQAAEALLRINPSAAEGELLLQHRRSDVRARAMMEMLKHLDEQWAQAALENQAPFALEYAVVYK